MSAYFFLPRSTPTLGGDVWVKWESGFSEDELDRIERIGDVLTAKDATVSGFANDEDISDIRITKTAWINNVQNNVDDDLSTGWLYDKLAFIARRLNGDYYDFDINGFAEDFQYTVYQGSVKAHYDWHVDMGCTEFPRKLSMVLFLTDPKKYKGGNLQIKTGSTEITLPNKRGTVVAFPSWALHRVVPVTKGIRKTLVVWTTGPRFK